MLDSVDVKQGDRVPPCCFTSGGHVGFWPIRYILHRHATSVATGHSGKSSVADDAASATSHAWLFLVGVYSMGR